MSQTPRAIERMLPQSIEAEYALLGSIIIDPEALALVADFLRAEDFYRDGHRSIYEVMLHLYNQQRAADFITICDVLESRGKLEEVGGASYISGLVNQVPSSGNVLFYARIVERTAVLRNLIRAAGQIAAMAYEAEDDAIGAVEQAEQLIFSISQRSLSLGTDASLAELLTFYMNKLDQLHQQHGTIIGVPTGFAELDRLTGGLRRSDLIVLAARPSIGKTSMSLSLACQAALRYRQRIGIFSLEMSQEQLTERLMAMETGINLQRLSTGNIEEHEWERVVTALERLSDAQIRIDGTSVLSPVQMRSRARRWVVEHGLDLIIVDYMQLLQPGDTSSKRRLENRVQVIDEISRNLKLLARELNIPILVLAQLSRAVESRLSKVPQLSDLRECVVGGTRLIDAKTGKWKPIAEIQQGDEVLGLGEGQKIGRFAVENVWSTGEKPVYRLTTRTGRQITATANHPLLTASGWKSLGEMQVGERIATALCLPEHGQEMPERADLCRFLGYMVGDGTYQKHRGVGFISSDPETFEDAVTIALTHFPDITPHPHKCQGNAQEVYFSGLHANGYGKPHGNSLREWIRSLDIFGEKDATKHVPEWVFEAGRIGACEFLAGYLSADGCVKRVTGSKAKPWEVRFDTVSRQLANDIQALLLRIGVIASVNNGYVSSKATQPIYHVAVAVSAHNLRRFAEQVHPCGKKGRLLYEMIEALPQKNQTRPGVFALPSEISAYLASCVVGQVPKVTAWQWTHGKRQASRDTVAYWADKLVAPILAEWAESDLLWEPIRSIEPVGEAEVFDICVPGCANFLADGIVAHNSGGIENNADIVLFIYRDEVYNPNTERRGVADIIVAKHRNGPIGTFCLEFEAQTTRFRDPADEVVVPLSLSPEEIDLDDPDREDDEE